MIRPAAPIVLKRTRQNAGGAMLTVMLIMLFLFPIVAMYAKRTAQNTIGATKSRMQQIGRTIALNGIEDFMRYFSLNYYGNHYLKYFLDGHSPTYIGGKLTTKYNDGVNSYFTEAKSQAHRVFVFKHTGGTYQAKTEGVVSFRSDFLRFGLVVLDRLDVTVNDALDGQTLTCGLWTGEGLSINPGASLSFDDPPNNPNFFGSTTAVVVNGDITGTANITVNSPVRVNYSGTLPAFPAPPYYNYMPVDLSSTTFPRPDTLDITYYQTHCATGTTVAGTTVTIYEYGLEIERPGILTELYITSGPPITFYDSSPGPLFIRTKSPVPDNWRMKVTIAAQGNIIIPGDVKYQNGADWGTATNTHSLAVIAGGNLMFGEPGNLLDANTDVTGYYYTGGSVLIYGDFPNRTINLRGALTIAGTVPQTIQDIVGNGWKLNIEYDPSLRGELPEFMPEKPVLVHLRATAD